MNSMNLLKDQEKELQKQFKKFDLNGDGFLTFEEIEKAFGQIKMDKKAKEAMLESLTLADQDGDKRISYAEF